MKPFGLATSGERLSVLCLGAHSDDIEIGAGGTIIELIGRGAKLDVTWCVLSAAGERKAEATASAEAFLEGAQSRTIETADFEDSYFPDQQKPIKTWMIAVRDRVRPDIVFTHTRRDGHQDHRQVNALTWNVFRDHLILEYEILKWDGDLGRPNSYVPLSEKTMERKTDLLMRHFGSQRSKDWFDPDAFRALARLRGMECRAPERFAEAFTVRKTRLF
ncbi:PIG-L deacetylase family protein [Pararhizobium haloflavum]|uniref:PIG-L deacetylase family protein n=1 Tax=Pararhizobium haloflavum TaxID=2037914 RepID=UPI000C1975F8|nr:PIG-L deacetylase family protein [Pararhizobium haloflavum]